MSNDYDGESSPYIIRKMTSEDIVTVLHIEKQSNINMLNENILKNYLDTPNTLLYIAEFNFEVIGFVIFTLLFDHIDIDYIAVLGDFRRKGVATSLLEKVTKTAFKHNIQDVFLEVRLSNNIAKSFYENNGFEKISVRKNYYTNNQILEDAVIYKKEIFKLNIV